MGKAFENNRSSAPTVEMAAQINTDLLASVKEAFAAGVTAGRQEVLLALEEEVISRQNLAVTK
jgi:hypothetical protein